VAQGVVPAKRECADLLRVACLQSCVAAVRIRAELVDAAEALVERLAKGVGGKAALAHVLVAVELNLIGFVKSSGAYKIYTQVAMTGDLFLNAHTVLVIDRSFEGARWKRVEADGERANGRFSNDARAGRAPRSKGLLKAGVRGHSRIDRTSRYAGRDADSTHLSSKSANECSRIRRIGSGEVGDLRRYDVAEDTEASMNSGAVRQLVGD
jgi:hypothetical protein